MPDVPRLLRRDPRPRIIRRMLNAAAAGMLAIRTGAASGLVVVDVEPTAGGRETLTKLVRRGVTQSTRYVNTGSGGLHLYYRHPGSHVKIPSSQGRLGPDVDVRADGGYVVALPSVHPGHPTAVRVGRRDSGDRGDGPRTARRCLTQPLTIPRPSTLASPALPPRSGGPSPTPTSS